MSDSNEMPKEAKVGIGLAGLGTLALAAQQNWMLLLKFLPVAIAVVGGLLFAYAMYGRWRSNRKGIDVNRGLKSRAGDVPIGVTEGGRVTLDGLRKSFDEGLERFRKSGKSLYDFPWYVVVGERGSGKTEFIDKGTEDVRPSGFNKPLQGSGGTVNMNWWFTNYAVLLDTAGALMLPEVETADNDAWDKFLGMVQEKRFDCPVNGLLLMIPADTLLTDSPEEINRKSGQIAQQFGRLQEKFGVRFPVFVVITKCDKINGFREFFERIQDPTQMLGWSNPTPLDEPFRAQTVTDHLQKVHDQLVRRRFQLLAAMSNANDESVQRLDQVDALYEFPDELLRIAPGLRSYLEPIFMAGTWTAMPLFLRGIYFTSTLQTGEALDKVISAALGYDVKSRLGGSIVGKKRMFLRDVFVEKVFPEKGLVTRAGNTDRLRRKRKLALLGSGIAAVMALIGVTALETRPLSRSFARSHRYWGEDVQTAIDQRHRLFADDGAYNKGLTRLLADAPTEVRTELEIPLMFRGAGAIGAADIQRRKQMAFETFYTRCFLSPLLQRASEQLQLQKVAWNDNSTEALKQLIRLALKRADAVSESQGLDPIFRVALPEDDFKNREDTRRLTASTFRELSANPSWQRDEKNWDAHKELQACVRRFMQWANQPPDASFRGSVSQLDVAMAKYDQTRKQLIDASAGDLPTTTKDASAFVDRWRRAKSAFDAACQQLQIALNAIPDWQPASGSLDGYCRGKLDAPVARRIESCDQVLKSFGNARPAQLGDLYDAVAELQKNLTAQQNSVRDDRSLAEIGRLAPSVLSSAGGRGQTLFQTSSGPIDFADDLLHQAAQISNTSVQDWDNQLPESTLNEPGNPAGAVPKDLQTSANRAVIVAGRIGRTTVIQSFLKELKDRGWNSLVASKQVKTGVLVDLTIDSKFNPAAFNTLLKDQWAPLFAYIHRPATEPGAVRDRQLLDAPEITKDYEADRADLDKYVEDYRTFWTKTAPNHLVDRGTYLDTRDRVASLKSRIDSIDLQIAGAMNPLRNLGRADPAAPSDLADKVNRALQFWEGNDSRDARLKLLAFDQEQINTYCTVSRADQSPQSAGELFWDEVLYQIIASLKLDAVRDADAAYTRLTSAEYAKFPLVRDAKQDLAPSELKLVRSLLERIGKPAPTANVRAPSSGRIGIAIAELRAPLSKANRIWLERVSDLLDLLDPPDGRNPLTCTVFVMGCGGNPKVKNAWDKWSHWALCHGVDAKYGDPVDRGTAEKNIPQMVGNAVPVREGRWVMNFYFRKEAAQHFASDDVMHLCDNEAWAALHMISGGLPEKPSEYVVTRDVNGESKGGNLAVELKLQFSKPVVLPDGPAATVTELPNR